MVFICEMNDRRRLSGGYPSSCTRRLEDGAGLEHGLVSIFCDRGFVNRLRIDESDDAKNGGGAPGLHFDSSPSSVEGIRMDTTGCEAKDGMDAPGVLFYSSPSSVEGIRMNCTSCEAKDGRDAPYLRSDSDYSLVSRLGIEDAVGGAEEGSDFPKSCRDSNGVSLGLGVSTEPETLENYDFSDVVLKYIGEILMEDDVQEKACMFQESAALHATERSFYEVLGQSYQPLLSGEPEAFSCVTDISSFKARIGILIDL